jgi:DNA-directed RNA polymerase alpha subunit
MTGPYSAGLPWTRGEDDQLRAMLEAGMKAPAIARKIKRTVAAVRTRRTVLNKREAELKAKGKERLRRELAAGPMLYPSPELPDDTLIENVQFSTRIRNALTIAGWKTVGEIREASDATLLGLQHLGYSSVAHLREKLGLKAKRK